MFYDSSHTDTFPHQNQISFWSVSGRESSINLKHGQQFAGSPRTEIGEKVAIKSGDFESGSQGVSLNGSILLSVLWVVVHSQVCCFPMQIQQSHNMQFKPHFRRKRLQCSDASSSHLACIRNPSARQLRRLTGCYIASHLDLRLS